MPREIITHWVTASGSSDRTVMFFDPDIAVEDQRDAIADFFAGTEAARGTTTNWFIETAGRVLDTATGAVTGAWTDARTKAGVGTTSGAVVPDSSQIVMRWLTAVVVDGRFLRGRTFIPGSAIGAVSQGNVGAGTVSLYNTEGQALADALVGFSIWHRPTSGAGGTSQPVLTADCWNEFGVLRRRRT